MSDTTPNSDIPFDDYGIHNDRVLDICENLVLQLWTKIVEEKQSLSISEIKDASMTMDSLWNLVQSVLDIEGILGNDEDISEDNGNLDV